MKQQRAKVENEIMCHFPEKAGIVLDSGGWKKMESENAHYFKYFEFNLKFILLIRPAPYSGYKVSKSYSIQS